MKRTKLRNRIWGCEFFSNLSNQLSSSTTVVDYPVKSHIWIALGNPFWNTFHRSISNSIETCIRRKLNEKKRF
jgi:hypothetical protein